MIAALEIVSQSRNSFLLIFSPFWVEVLLLCILQVPIWVIDNCQPTDYTSKHVMGGGSGPIVFAGTFRMDLSRIRESYNIPLARIV